MAVIKTSTIQFEKIEPVTNDEMAGWIYIKGTTIDCPVMQTDSIYFNGMKEVKADCVRHGCPVIQRKKEMDNSSDNIVIYGHYTKNNYMSKELEKYKDVDFWNENKVINFDTFVENGIYMVMSVLLVPEEEKKLKFHHSFHTKNEMEYDNFIDICTDNSLYDTNISAKYGDKLITLSTLDYSQNNDNLIVVAKKI